MSPGRQAGAVPAACFRGTEHWSSPCGFPGMRLGLAKAPRAHPGLLSCPLGREERERTPPTVTARGREEATEHLGFRKKRGFLYHPFKMPGALCSQYKMTLKGCIQLAPSPERRVPPGTHARGRMLAEDGHTHEKDTVKPAGNVAPTTKAVERNRRLAQHLPFRQARYSMLCQVPAPKGGWATLPSGSPWSLRELHLCFGLPHPNKAEDVANRGAQNQQELGSPIYSLLQRKTREGAEGGLGCSLSSRAP